MLEELQSRMGKFFGSRRDGSYRHTIYPIDLQVGLLLRNTLFFVPVELKDFYTFGGEASLERQCGNLMSTPCKLLEN